MMEKIQKFIREVRKEFDMVSWPKQEQVVGSTGVVIFVTIVLAIFVLIADKILEKAIFLIM